MTTEIDSTVLRLEGSVLLEALERRADAEIALERVERGHGGRDRRPQTRRSSTTRRWVEA